MVTDPTHMCELLVGFTDVTVLGLDNEVGAPLSIHVETRARRPGCSDCGVLARVKDRPVVTLVDLAAFGRPTRLVWHKFLWHCAELTCPGGSWTEDEPSIAAKRLMLSDRVGRSVTEQVGRHARTVNEIAVELGCDWHTINDTVVAYGTPWWNPKTGSERWRPSVSTRCSSPESVHGAATSSLPRSST